MTKRKLTPEEEFLIVLGDSTRSKNRTDKDSMTIAAFKCPGEYQIPIDMMKEKFPDIFPTIPFVARALMAQGWLRMQEQMEYNPYFDSWLEHEIEEALIAGREAKRDHEDAQRLRVESSLKRNAEAGHWGAVEENLDSTRRILNKTDQRNPHHGKLKMIVDEYQIKLNEAIARGAWAAEAIYEEQVALAEFKEISWDDIDWEKLETGRDD